MIKDKLQWFRINIIIQINTANPCSVFERKEFLIMKTMEKFFLNILILLIIALLCGCQGEDSKILTVAEKKLESGLESDLQNGYLHYYKILKAELYTPNAEDSDNPDLVEQCKTANTHIVYELRLGDNTGETGLVQMERYSHVEKDESGNLVEIPEDTVYFDYDLHEKNAGTYEETVAGLNCVIWSNDYQPRIGKEQVQGKSTEEIAKILFKDWMNSFREWRNNSFLVTDFENVKILGMEPAADNPVAGYTKEELEYPDAKKTYVFGAACDYTYIRIGPEAFGSLTAGGGQSFGNDGVKIKASESFIDTTNGFVLTEWEDSYSMDTISNCKKKIVNAS